MFICNHCPYVQAIRERLIALQASYDPHVVQLIGINANDATNYPDDSPEAMTKAIAEFGINFPYLIDESQEVAQSYQAQCTPDIYVFDQERKLAYHGRLDDNWKEPEKVTKQELKAAIDTLLRGEPAPIEQIFSIGCSIKWKA
jgi:thiol-disulfide isomerase/thioredoxin